LVGLLAEPAFAALVVLDLAIRLAGTDLGEAERELLDVGVLAEGVGTPARCGRSP